MIINFKKVFLFFAVILVVFISVRSLIVSSEDYSEDYRSVQTNSNLSYSADVSNSSIDFRLKNNLPVPAINDQAALVVDLKTRVRYFSLNVDKIWPMASLTKLMTAVIALENLNQNQVITISKDDLMPYDGFIKEGDSYSVLDLIKLMMMISSNSSAQSLANFYGYNNFISKMNLKAKEIGMLETQYVEPVGLSQENVSSASDIEKLVSYIYKNYPIIFEISKNAPQIVYNWSDNKSTAVGSIDQFANQSDFLGGKSGYTDQAKENLVSIFSYDNHPILVVVLGSDNNFIDTEKLFTWFKESYSL